VIDVGPDAMSNGYKNYKAIATELGFADRFVASSSVVGTVRDGKVHHIDTQSVVSMVTTRALTWRGKLRFAAGLWKIRKMFAGVSSSRLVEAADLDDEADNAQLFAERFLGQEAADYVIDPLMRLVVGSGARQASRLGIFGGMVDWAIPLINFKGGLDTLPVELARHVPVTVNATVDQLMEDSDGVRVQYLAEDGGRCEIRSDVCVLAATYDAAEAIYPKLSSYVAGYGEKLKYISMVTVSLAYARAPNSKAYVVQVPTVENQDISLIFLQHNKAPDRVPPGSGLITLYTDAIATSRYVGLSDAVIERWARGEVERLFPEIREHFQFSQITRWQIVGYLAVPGFWLRTRDLLSKLPKDSRIQIAGDLFGAGSMESAVTWGQRAAERIIEHWPKSSSDTSEIASH